MKLSTYLLFILMGTLTTTVSAQLSPLGTWKTIDDVTGEAKSYIEIYQENGLTNGKIVKLLQRAPDTICESCKGAKKNQPLMGMIVLEGLSKEKEVWSGGTIMDPENGKTYKCKLSMESNDKLKVRGYIGIEALGRNQYWTRVE